MAFDDKLGMVWLILVYLYGFSALGAYVIAWKRGIAILTAGNVKVSPDPRLGLVNGHYLQIENAVPQDGGEYVCQIATLEPIEITHLVDILGAYMNSDREIWRPKRNGQTN